MLYSAKKDKNHSIQYLWNKVFSPIDNIKGFSPTDQYLAHRFWQIQTDKTFVHLQNIDNAIFLATVEYFNKIVGAKWANLPLTTLMISSPGEVYAGQKLDYTTDTLPVELPNWFDSPKRMFLSESSQFYLELALMTNGADSVFSIYNSFRKEKSDFTHLTEFQHIEYEWKVDFEWNKNVSLGLVDYIIAYIFENNISDLQYFLSEEDLAKRNQKISQNLEVLTFAEALEILYKDTNDSRYKEFSLKNFWSWEEIRLTEIVGKNVSVEKFPMLQIPFYHAIAKEEYNGVPLAQNADIIFQWYREVIWSGVRIADKATLLKKAEIFNLPQEDYMPYLSSRDDKFYEPTAWFWLGWQRLVHWLLKMPTIIDSTVFPRTHLTPNP